jgi:ABC-type multidrug transport system fused ATPase/permease subunit
VALTLANIAFNLLKPWPFKFIVDGVLDKTAGTADTRALVERWFGAAEPALAILWLCGAMVAISLIGGLVNLASNYLFVHVGLQALLKLRTDLYSTLQALPLKFHDSRRSADSSFRVAYDSQSIQTIYNKGFATVLSSLVMLVATFVVMVRMNWPLTLASLAILPPVVWAIPGNLGATVTPKNRLPFWSVITSCRPSEVMTVMPGFCASSTTSIGMPLTPNFPPSSCLI